MMGEENIKLLSGIIFSNIAGAVVPDVVDNDAIYISANAAPSTLAGDQCNANYFVASWQNDSLHEASGLAAKQLGYKRAFILAPNYQAGKDALNGFKRTFGGDVIGEIYTQLDQTDYSAEMAQIRAAKPDVVFPAHSGGMGIAFLRQYQQAGLLGQIPVILSEPSGDAVTFKSLGDAAVGLKVTSHWSPDFDNAASKELVAKWKATYPDRPLTYYGTQGYDVARLIASALKRPAISTISVLSAPNCARPISSPCAAISASARTSIRFRTGICSKSPKAMTVLRPPKPFVHFVKTTAISTPRTASFKHAPARIRPTGPIWAQSVFSPPSADANTTGLLQ